MKQENKPKLLYIFIAAVFILFFSNDFGLIDVEKTSIITAIAIDKEDDEFLLTAQIAVPEATDANTENLKTQLSGKGSTVGAALKDLGDISGWFPKLAFCNLILVKFYMKSNRLNGVCIQCCAVCKNKEFACCGNCCVTQCVYLIYSDNLFLEFVVFGIYQIVCFTFCNFVNATNFLNTYF